MAASQDCVGAASTQNSIDAIIDKEIGVIVASLRPKDEPSSLVAQPQISDAVARLKGKMSQLIGVAESVQIRNTTTSPPRHSEDVERLYRHDTGDTQAQKDHSPQMRSVDVNLGESHKTYPDITNDRLRDAGPSLMMRKFMAAEANAEEVKADWDRREAAILQDEEEKRHSKEWYFFYGSLMDPKQLQQVLGRREPPRGFHLRPAEIIGYHIRMWGPYPVLLDGPPGNVVKGVAYEIEGGEYKDKLARYETANYREHNCMIQFSAEESVIGTTFQWAGDESDLRDGSFDLKDWQMTHLLDD